MAGGGGGNRGRSAACAVSFVTTIFPLAMDESTASVESNSPRLWVAWFLSLKGSEYFCEVDEAYIEDRFNLTGLNTEVQYFQQACELICDQMGIGHELERSRDTHPTH